MAPPHHGNHRHPTSSKGKGGSGAHYHSRHKITTHSKFLVIKSPPKTDSSICLYVCYVSPSTKHATRHNFQPDHILTLTNLTTDHCRQSNFATVSSGCQAGVDWVSNRCRPGVGLHQTEIASIEFLVKLNRHSSLVSIIICVGSSCPVTRACLLPVAMHSCMCVVGRWLIPGASQNIVSYFFPKSLPSLSLL